MLAVGTGAYAATYVNGEDVTNEVFTTISNDYTLFPVRYLGEKLGCDVSWNPNDKCISVSKEIFTEISITEVRQYMTGTETAITL